MTATSLAAARINRLERADHDACGGLSDLHRHAWAISERAASADEAGLAGYPGEALRVLTICDTTHGSGGFSRVIARAPTDCADAFDYLRRLEILGDAPRAEAGRA